MNERSARGGMGDRGGWLFLGAALVFLIALNLRPALTSVGPLLPMIGREFSLGEGAQGLLGAMPLLAFAAVSPFISRPANRFGLERVLFAGLLLLAAGIAVRSFTGSVGLWVGTLMLSSAIAIGNVLVPALVKRDFRNHVSLATGFYTVFITLGAASASLSAVPLARSFGWQTTMAFWVIPALAVALLWAPRTARGPEQTTVAPEHANLASVWKQKTAWIVTAFMGLQSTMFYFMNTWLPTIAIWHGHSPERAGFLLFLFQIVGIPASLLIPRLMRREDNQVAAAVLAGVLIAIAVAGLLFVPGLIVLWAVIGGLGSGAALVVSLSIISLRGRTQRETTQLSGMAQSIGYLFASVTPIVAGRLTEVSGNWSAALAVVLAIAIIMVIVAIPAGRGRSQS